MAISEAIEFAVTHHAALCVGKCSQSRTFASDSHRSGSKNADGV
jgi:hypothetical protein